jgi:outer membrane protein TolC
MRRLLSFLCLCPLVVAGGLAAETSVSEERVLAAFDGSHPAARAQAGELGAAEAEHRRARLLSDPRLEVGREELESVERETVWAVAWTPPLDGRRRWAIRAAEAAVEAEEGGLAASLLDLRREVREVYADWAAGAARADLLSEHTARLGALAERMRRRTEAGEESRLDAGRLTIEHESYTAALSGARAAAVGARARVAAWLVDDGLDVSNATPALPELPEVPTGIDPTALPDLRAALARVAEAAAVERLSRRVASAPEILVGWKSVEATGSDISGPVVALSWTVPVLDRRRADRMAAESAVATAQAHQDWVTRRAGGDFVAAVAAYEELRHAARSAGSSRANLDAVAMAATAAYEQGESTVTDLLDSLRAVVEARLRALDLYFAALAAHRQLEVAAGLPLTSGDLS